MEATSIFNRILKILAICILLPIWAIGLGFGWIATGKNLMDGNWIEKKLEKLID